MYPTLTKEEQLQINEAIEKDIQENGRYICSYCYKQYKEETAVKNVCQECLETRFADFGAKTEGCAFCEHLQYEYDCDDMGYDKASWFECNKMPQYQGLNTFPFKNTPKKCIEKGYFKARKTKHHRCR